jgi:two-component system sensor histidine kinase/response regulator
MNTITMLEDGHLTHRLTPEMLRDAQAIAQVGSFHWKVASDSLLWSDELYRIFGVAAQDFQGRYDAYLERVHPDDRTEVQQIINRALAEGGRFNLEFRIIRPDGEVRWILSRCRVTRNTHGESIAIEGTCQDVTECRRAEDKIRCISEFHEAIIRNAAEGICVYHTVSGTIK